MIRYIDIGDQIKEGKSQFAWFDIIKGEFLEFNEDQVWDMWEDFQNDFWHEVNYRKSYGDKTCHIYDPEGHLECFKRLYPLNLKRDNPPEKELVLEED